MKKNILLLINGFGIERNDSYNVYSASLMPNMDRLTREKIFLSIPNKYLDYKNAYRCFSMGIDNPLTYTLIDNNISEMEYKENKLLRYITNETVKYKSRLHIICFWDSDTTIEQLSEYLREIQKQSMCRIFVHLVLCQRSLNDYKTIERGFNILSYESGQNVKIGVVTGEANFYDLLSAKDLAKNFITEFGEKWKDLSKKIEVLIQTKTPPYNVRTFSVNPTYKFEQNDQVLIYNYNNVDLTCFRNELLVQKYRQLNVAAMGFYSLFPVKAEKQIPFMYNFAVSANYTLKSLSDINARCLVMDKKDNCSIINYYLTGLRNSVDEKLKYLITDDNFIYDSNKLLQTIANYDKELYIINYEINTCKDLTEMNNRLKSIDNIIGVLDNYIKENNYGLIISSLYGLETSLYNSKHELCKINFSGRVPIIIDDNNINPSLYTVVEGSLYDLANTIYKNINPQFKKNGLLKKKSGLLSFLYKKPKGGK